MTSLSAGISRSIPAPRNRVMLVLVLVAAAAALGTGFVTVAPNRLVSGAPILLWRAAPGPFTASLAVMGVALLALALAPVGHTLSYLAAVIAGAALIATLAAAGVAAASLAPRAAPATAISLGVGFWVIFASAALALIDVLQRAKLRALTQLSVVVLAVAIFIAMAKAGMFDALSVAKEYASRRETFAAAVTRHVELVVAAIVPALVIGVPLGLVGSRRKGFETPLFAVLNLLQTIPSIALFGLLITPLSALANWLPALAAVGVGGVGPAPAIIALVLYALLPIARNTVAGISGVPPAAIDAARGMGMTPRQVFRQVELPLALPVLLAGLRIVTVQAIGLAVVAALIGAGGLGSFVFDGLGQYATDLVLLGALPAILMALLVDFLLRLSTAGLNRRVAA